MLPFIGRIFEMRLIFIVVYNSYTRHGNRTVSINSWVVFFCCGGELALRAIFVGKAFRH